MYFTNKKELERYKINEINYRERMEVMKKSLTLKQMILKYGSVIGLLLILSMMFC